MQQLIEGVRAFHTKMMAGGSAAYETLAEGQDPNTLFVTCADSRVVPAFIASAEPGELFIVRNVGNLIPPSDLDGASLGDRSEASAIEYAVEKLSVTDVVVCGHSGCGAMAALLAAPSSLPVNLAHWLEHARGALDDARFPASLGDGCLRADVLSQRSVLIQMKAMRTYPEVRRRMDLGLLRVHGWWFDIRSTRVHVYAPRSERFVAFEDAYHEAPRE